MENANSQHARGRPRAFDRTTALDQALDLFWRRGYEATSISELTSGMGLTPPSLYAAFGSKHELFLEAMRRYQELYGERITHSLDEDLMAKDAIERMLREAADVYSSLLTPPGCFIVTAATNCSPASSDVEAALRERRNMSEERVRERIAAGIAAGELSMQTDARALAKFYATIIQGMSIQARDGATHAELDAVVDSAMAAWPQERLF
jgi:AcrR family transcriptional regulator